MFKFLVASVFALALLAQQATPPATPPQGAPPQGRGGRGGGFGGPQIAPMDEAGFRPIFDGKNDEGLGLRSGFLARGRRHHGW